MNNFRAVIFDLFYTLINPLAPRYMNENEYQVLGMTGEEFEKYNARDYSVRACGGIKDPYEMCAHILRGLPFSREIIRKAAGARLERIRRGLFGIEEKNLALLRRLREAGVKTALLSNADIADIWHWKDCPLSACFDETVFSFYAGCLKPDPQIYRIVLDKLGLPPSACLYVGDGGHSELKGAQEVDMTTVLTTEYIVNLWPQKIPVLIGQSDHVITKIEDIERIAFNPQ
ncbi:MAG: HAD-IA family hydrolase [Treponema sp.]|jgi:putative hydrolase of the HAD superfamily|nr:HAD-IA family hydrolase [Treponema sp.]